MTINKTRACQGPEPSLMAMLKLLLWLGLAGLLVSCAGTDQSDPGRDAIAGAPQSAAEFDAEVFAGKSSSLSGKQLFLACAACHTLERNAEPGVGPGLADLDGRLAGNFPGFNYSPALQESGLIWNRGTLTGWILQTELMVPGTWMLYHNHLSVSEVQKLVDYVLDPDL